MASTIDATSVELEPARNLLRIDDPVAVIPAAKRIAADLKREIQASGKVQRINGKEYVLYEGWQTLVAMLGCTTRIVDTQSLGNGSWKARAEIVTADGRVIGSGEGLCSSDEKSWGRRDEFARLSMSQVRAAQRAARIAFAWVLTLGGLEATPPEELDSSMAEPERRALPTWAKPATTAEVMRVSRCLVAIFRACGSTEPAKATAEIGKLVRARTGDQVPVLVVNVIEDLVAVALKPVEGDETEPAS